MIALLTTSSHKIDLTLENAGVIQAVLNLPPATSGGAGNLCPFATAGCMRACLQYAGRNPMSDAVNARKNRLVEFLLDRPAFLAKLREEIGALVRRAERSGKRALVRLNGLSDLDWTRIAPELFEAFPGVQFMDYTKDRERYARFLADRTWPRNYHLTFSRSETNEEDCEFFLRMGGTVAIVFAADRPLPAEWKTFPVVNGDLHDNRSADKAGTVLGLKAKGAGRKDQTGFVVR